MSLRRPRVANFADIIKIATIFTKKTFKGSKKKIKRISNYVLKCNLYPNFLILQKLIPDFCCKNADVTKKLSTRFY